MYPRNAASPERIGVGAVVQISDGAVQTSAVSISVRGQGGASGAGAGTTAYDNGIVEYTPTQGETDFTSFVVVAYKTGCIPVAMTVITSASATPGNAGLDWGKVINPTTVVGLSGTTVKTATDVETATTNLQSRTPAALTANGNMKSSMVEILTTALTETAGLLAGGFKKFFNVAAPTGTANSLPDAVAGAAGGVFIAGSNAATTANITGNLTGNVSGSVGSVAGAVGSVTGAVGSVTGLTASDVGAIKAKTDSLTFTVAGQVDANIQSVNDVTVTGTGAVGDEWGP